MGSGPPARDHEGSWEEGSASGCISKKNRAATAHGGRRCGGATDCSMAQRATVPVGDDGVWFSLAKGIAACCRRRGDGVGECDRVEELERRGVEASRG